MEHEQSNGVHILASPSQKVFVRVAGDVLRSNKMLPISKIFSEYGLTDIELSPDLTDAQVLYTDLPVAEDGDVTNKIVNALNKQGYVDEAWAIKLQNT
jgi:hypothetical protein